MVPPPANGLTKQVPIVLAGANGISVPDLPVYRLSHDGEF